MSGLSFGLISLAVLGVRAIAAASNTNAFKSSSNSTYNTARNYEQNYRQPRQPIQYYNGYYNTASTPQTYQNQYTANYSNTPKPKTQQPITQNNFNTYNRTQKTSQAQTDKQIQTYSDNLGHLRNDIQNNMNEQIELNRKASEEMMKEIEQARNEMHTASDKSLEDYDEYLGLMKEKRQEMFNRITEHQEKVNREYRNKISESMVQITSELNEKHKQYLTELTSLKDNIQAKNEKASEIAKSYINEAQTTIKSLIEDFEGEKYVRRELIALNNQMNKAIEQYNKGYYETAVATSKDVLIGTVEEIYHADEMKQEWENYYKTALVLSTELMTFIETQEIITQEVFNSIKSEQNIELNEEIIGTRIADYTGKNSQGTTKYDYIKQKAKEIDDMLKSDDAKNLSTQQLKQYTDYINTVLYPQAACCITQGILNMDNAYSRQNMSDDIVEFFEEHDFNFKEYTYDENRHDKPLHLYFTNDTTGEELVISLSPQALENGEVQTRVELEQVKGDETNEERKAYYRECINQVITHKNPGSSVNIQCDKSTVNKLSNGSQAEKRRKLQNQ